MIKKKGTAYVSGHLVENILFFPSLCWCEQYSHSSTEGRTFVQLSVLCWCYTILHHFTSSLFPCVLPHVVTERLVLCHVALHHTLLHNSTSMVGCVMCHFASRCASVTKEVVFSVCLSAASKKNYRHGFHEARQDNEAVNEMQNTSFY